MKAIIFPTDGDPRVEDITPDLATLKELVGGYIEAAPTNGDVTVYVNEEGKINGLPPNTPATFFWWSLAPFMKGHDVISGPAVILGPADDEGDETPVPDQVIALLGGEAWLPGDIS